MTSIHRLIAISVVWLAFASATVILLMNSLFLPPYAIIVMSIVFVGAALAATWLISRIRNA
jgi:hypothetical protein